MYGSWKKLVKKELSYVENKKDVHLKKIELEYRELDRRNRSDIYEDGIDLDETFNGEE